MSLFVWLLDRIRAWLGGRRSARRAEREAVIKLLVFLNGRRVLFDPMTLEEPSYVAASVLAIRQRLDELLAELPLNSPASPVLRDMQRYLLQYLTRAPTPATAIASWPTSINDLRGGVRSCIEDLERLYKISMPGGTGRPIGVLYVPGPDEP